MRKKSMNSDVRRRELMKITIENQAILKRLQDKTSNYSVERWEDQFKETEKRMKNICEYPVVFQSNPGYLKAKQMGLLDDQTRFQTATELPGLDSGLLSRGGMPMPRAGTAVSANRKDLTRSFNTLVPQSTGAPSISATEAKRVLIKQAEALDENRIVLYKKGRQMGNGYYIVEISSNNSCLFIAAYDVESPESFLIELSEKKAEEIMKEFNNDYEMMS